MKRDDEPKVWVIVVKLVVGALALIGAVGGALIYAERAGIGAPASAPTQTGTSWGVSSDSPVNMKR
ncbi:MAG: hypothetical protein RIR45_358 [Pseudomonadota bacterium]|jgi:uncharacterized membrane protein